MATNSAITSTACLTASTPEPFLVVGAGDGEDEDEDEDEEEDEGEADEEPRCDDEARLAEEPRLDEEPPGEERTVEAERIRRLAIVVVVAAFGMNPMIPEGCDSLCPESDGSALSPMARPESGRSQVESIPGRSDAGIELSSLKVQVNGVKQFRKNIVWIQVARVEQTASSLSSRDPPLCSRLEALALGNPLPLLG